MDVLNPEGQDLQLNPHLATIALLPGSRLPEAIHNLALQLKVCETLAQLETVQFRVALVNSITESDLENLAKQERWNYQSIGIFTKKSQDKLVTVKCYYHAFSDIIHQCNLVIGMAGTAVEQAVGLGKPVIQLPGKGPQFTYKFAEAQMRLLGISVKTIGKSYKNPMLLTEAANMIQEILRDNHYLKKCKINGNERVGEPGGSQKIAQAIAKFI